MLGGGACLAFHFAKRKEAKTRINIGVFVQSGTALRDADHATNHYWVVKADADAVFLPWKLVDKAAKYNCARGGAGHVNCKFVNLCSASI